MGYDTRSPKQSFASGGTVDMFIPPSPQSSSTSLADVNWGSISAIGQLVQIFNQTFRRLGEIGIKSASFTRNFLPFVNFLRAQDTGVFDRLNTAFTVIQNMLQAAQVLGGRVAAAGMPTAQQGYLSGIQSPYHVGAGGFVSQVLPSDAQDTQQIGSLEQQRTYLKGESSLVGTTLGAVRKKLEAAKAMARKDPGKYTSVIQGLTQAYNDLLARMQALTGAIAQNVSDTFSAEQTRVQDFLNRVTTAYQTQQQSLQSQQTAGQTLGNYGQLPSIDAQLAASATAEIQALQPVLLAAQKTGDPALIAQVQQQIAQLQDTVVQATAQMIQDQISAVQQVASTQQAQVSEYQSIAQTMTSQATTPGQFAAASAMTQQALQLNQTSLQGQLGSYNTLLGQASSIGDVGAVATITQTIDQLTAALAQNYAALQDNTAQIVQQTASFIQARGQFMSGVYGGVASIINTIGQTTGFTDVGALKGVTAASTASLQGTNAGLVGQLGQLGGGASGIAAMLQGVTDPAAVARVLSGANLTGAESGQTSSWVTTFEGIISSLESNTQAIATNNQQLATLNGQLLQPQTWSTTSWSAFRAAVFTGMGNLLPSFQGTLSGGAVPTIAPAFGTAPGNSGTPTIGTLNITHPVETLDPTVLGQQLHYELSTAV